MSLPCIFEFLLLLLDLPVNFLADLSKLKLGTEDLVLLLLKSSLSFLKSGLELLLLNLKAPALLVKLMDGTATISKLVKKVADLISQVLVFPLHNIKLLNRFVIGSPETEQFTVIVPAFLLAGLNFSIDIISLGLPFTDNLKRKYMVNLNMS